MIDYDMAANKKSFSLAYLRNINLILATCYVHLVLTVLRVYLYNKRGKQRQHNYYEQLHVFSSSFAVVFNQNQSYE